MQVKQRLTINAVACAISALLVFITFSLALYRVNHAMEESRIADEIISISFEMVTLRSDYLRNNNVRAKEQWFAKQARIDGLLQSASGIFRSAEDKNTIAELSNDVASSKNIFSAIVANRQKSGFAADSTALARETENRLLSQLNMRVYEEVLHGRMLQEKSQAMLFSILSLAGWGIFGLLGTATALVLFNSWAMSLAITERFRRLREGAAVIGSGKLAHRIELNGDDEFVELAGTFNAMTAKLQGSHHALETENLERKRSEEALRLSEKQYRSLFENMLHGFAHCKMVYDKDGRPTDFIYLNVNYAFEKLTALTDVVGKRVTEVIPGIKEAHPELLEIYGRVALTGQPERLELEFKPLEIWLSISVYSPSREHFVAIFDNVTERRQAELNVLKLSEDLASRNLALESVNKELESYIYSISHDLRAPIRTMAGFAKIIADGYGDKLDAEGRNYLERIFRGSAQATRLIDEILSLAKISRQDIDRIEVDLSKEAAKIVEELRETDRERNIEVVVQPGLIASVDPRLIKLALANLLGNAWKFTAKTEQAGMEFGGFKKNGTTVYYVKDNGAGFNPQYTHKMFLPFHRLHSDNEFEGTGIGLALVERVIHRHGGKIWAEGEVGKGAAVYFTLQR